MSNILRPVRSVFDSRIEAIRSELIEEMLMQQLAALRSQGIV